MTTLPSYMTSAFPRFKELAVATAAAVMIVAGAAVVADTALSENPVTAPSLTTLAKADRLDSKLPGSCHGQAWGDWSSECLSALTGNSAGTRIRTVTIETRNVEEATSTLLRVAAR
ncbi:hypothetical protein HPQ64_14220 [Rhizobiales bacterium]|uniref:hypothetical protein n=1 Tax=Hongsoonwoonella zoysiae TaxID=2821844 RepID=UPI001560B5AB|nr:hypothetical protein [Hongsoonwoonella zoysiae]NRG18844.1 hypothetical protein [Hongsoonwoonella zoysiae]